ncbi:hypothetical protein IU427_12415 [Nocardia beijingensis]|uniref:hypothetical protein n=1 Tax=Nocardia beijingensis TaxID=95162 RepID=UPI0018940048|nr:hypothetical protein [Nocardia beijingensis]MBF6465978.1 hypothetical protein [Nocardia beijingensis]
MGTRGAVGSSNKQVSKALPEKALPTAALPRLDPLDPGPRRPGTRELEPREPKPLPVASPSSNNALPVAALPEHADWTLPVSSSIVSAGLTVMAVGVGAAAAVPGVPLPSS